MYVHLFSQLCFVAKICIFKMWQLKATHGFYKAIISTNLNPVKMKQQEIIPLIGLSVFFQGIFISLTALAGTMRDRSHGM